MISTQLILFIMAVNVFWINWRVTKLENKEKGNG